MSTRSIGALGVGALFFAGGIAGLVRAASVGNAPTRLGIAVGSIFIGVAAIAAGVSRR